MAATVPDFNGTFVNTANEGMEELLTAMGIGFLMRKAAAATGYGKDSAKHIITQTAETVEIKQEARTNFHNVFTLGAAPEKKVDPDGNEVLMTAAIVGDELVQTVFEDDGTTVKTLQKRTIKDGVITMTITVGAATATRIWTKQ